MKVLKFGGTSVGSAERIKNVATLVNNGEQKIVVLSAMSGTTNSLVEISNYCYKNNKDGATEVINELENKYYTVIDELLSKPELKKQGTELIEKEFNLLRSYVGKPFTEKEEKEILAQGEIISTHLFLYYNLEIGVKAAILPALDYMKIDENEEPIISAATTELETLISENADCDLYITQGFICRNPQGEIDNLKRGGSDYSASLIGAALSLKEIQIWTDIDGVHNNDPRFVEGTYPIAELSFDEAAELAYFGAKILHPLSILPAKVANIPVKLKNTMDPDAKGTTITNKITGNGYKAVAAKDGLTAIKIKSGRMLLAYGFLSKIFGIFEKHKTSIDMITTSEVAVSLTIDNKSRYTEILDEITKLGAVSVDEDQTIICVVGNLVSSEKGYAAEILECLKDIPVRMISYGGSKHNISILIDTKNKEKALKSLNKGLFK